MLEQLAGDDDVEGLVLERQRLVEVGPARLDPELGGSASASRSASTPTISFPPA